MASFPLFQDSIAALSDTKDGLGCANNARHSTGNLCVRVSYSAFISSSKCIASRGLGWSLLFKERFSCKSNWHWAELLALSQRFPDSISCSVCPFPHSMELSPPLSVLLGSVLSSLTPLKHKQQGKNGFELCCKCAQLTCSPWMWDTLRPRQFGTTFLYRTFFCFNTDFSRGFPVSQLWL